MKHLRLGAPVAAGVLLLALPAAAQTTATSGSGVAVSTAPGATTGTTTTGVTTTGPATTTVTTTTATGSGTTAPAATAGSFDRLSPGNQKIARALFDAQKPTATGAAPLSLNQIAAIKGQEGWGRAFKEMKAEGLVDAKNLGQVVSHAEHQAHTVTTASASGPVVVTTGSGRMVGRSSPNRGSGDAGSRGYAHGGGRGGKEYASADMTVNTAGGGTATGGSVYHGQGGASGGGVGSGGSMSVSAASGHGASGHGGGRGK